MKACLYSLYHLPKGPENTFGLTFILVGVPTIDNILPVYTFAYSFGRGPNDGEHAARIYVGLFAWCAPLSELTEAA